MAVLLICTVITPFRKIFSLICSVCTRTHAVKGQTRFAKRYSRCEKARTDNVYFQP